MDIKKIAFICHETNKAYCDSIGDTSQKHWDEAEEWQRESAIKGVQFALDNPDSQASAQHTAWLTDKIEAGWVYGPIKDASKKEHPCLVPYENLPKEQCIKDHLFRNVVRAFRGV